MHFLGDSRLQGHRQTVDGLEVQWYPSGTGVYVRGKSPGRGDPLSRFSVTPLPALQKPKPVSDSLITCEVSLWRSLVLKTSGTKFWLWRTLKFSFCSPLGRVSVQWDCVPCQPCQQSLGDLVSNGATARVPCDEDVSQTPPPPLLRPLWVFLFLFCGVFISPPRLSYILPFSPFCLFLSLKNSFLSFLFLQLWFMAFLKTAGERSYDVWLQRLFISALIWHSYRCHSTRSVTRGYYSLVLSVLTNVNYLSSN